MSEVLEVKRFYLPHAVHAVCPRCQADVVRDANEYLSYPPINRAFEVDFYCSKGCDKEWSQEMILRVKLEKCNV